MIKLRHPCPVCGWSGGFHDPKVHPVKVPDHLIIKPAIKPITRFWYTPDTTEYL